MAQQVDYRKLFGVQKSLEKTILKVCPNMQHKSGIYFYTREDENEKAIYIGQSVDCLKRSCSHLQGYQQRIDISLKKKGFYSPDNKLGWKLNVLYFPENKLDEMEKYYIDKYKKANYTIYNVEGGGKADKTMIGERKSPMGYRDGIKRGKTTLKKELNEIIDKYLVISVKKDNKLSQRMIEKFFKLLKIEEKEETLEENDKKS